jgi:hydrogenase nickel incorporation protein HypA/HybF
MHELSIAYSLVQAADAAAQEVGLTQVSAVHLQLGALSGIVKDALLFSYDLASQGTRLEGSKLVIQDVPVSVYCRVCQAEGALASIQRFCCPVCGTPTADIRRGRELDIVGLEVIDPADKEVVDETSPA